MTAILVIHGPNLDQLGKRQPELYGTETLEMINQRLQQEAVTLNQTISFYQSNAEHELIKRIHDASAERFDFILINPAAFTHTSIALRDALLSVAIPFIEVHLSNPHARETFRQVSYFTDIAVGAVMGFGAESYLLALAAANHYLKTHSSK